MNTHTGILSTVDAAMAQRLQQASEWFLCLREAPADEGMFARWIDWCSEDPQNLPAYEQIADVWQASAQPVAPATVTTAATAATPITVRRNRRPLALAASLAASLAVLAAGLYAYVHTAEAPDATQYFSTPIAMHSSNVLPDGSRVMLGAASRLSSRYSDSTRMISVEAGEAYFDVARDARRPFVVRAGALRVTALGTAFNVRRGHDHIVVTVEAGKVEVRPGAAAAAPVRAAAGHQIRYSLETGELTSTTVDPALAIAWQQGMLKYEREPLADVVADLNRYCAHRIEIADPVLARERYTGTVFGSHIDDWLGALESAFAVRVTRQSGGVRLIRAE